MADEAKNKKDKLASKVKTAVGVVIAILVLVWLFLPSNGSTTLPPADPNKGIRPVSHTETVTASTIPFKVPIWAPGWYEGRLSEVFTRNDDQGIKWWKISGGSVETLLVYNADRPEEPPIAVPRGQTFDGSGITHYRFGSRGRRTAPAFFEGELY